MISLISDLLQKNPGMYHFVKQCLFQLKGGAELQVNRPASRMLCSVTAAAGPRLNLEQGLRELDAAATSSLILADACTPGQERPYQSWLLRLNVSVWAACSLQCHATAAPFH